MMPNRNQKPKTKIKTASNIESTGKSNPNKSIFDIFSLLLRYKKISITNGSDAKPIILLGATGVTTYAADKRSIMLL